MIASFDLSGSVAIITGSTRGIGRAIAEALVEHGARVAISSRKKDACDQVSAVINSRHAERQGKSPKPR
jgi:NAD(P)-dependent dehydrogenase (short-subunit alcohol dehydrogenase family)